MTTSSKTPAKGRRVTINKAAVFRGIEYSPHPGQREIHKSKARHRVVSAGRRLGKSVIGGHELTVEAFITYVLRSKLERDRQRREFWIVGPEYSDSEKEFRVLWNDAKALEFPLDKPGSYNNPESGEMVLSLWNGLFLVHAKSAKYPGTLVGEGLSGVVMAEAAKLKPIVWSKFIRPTLADFRGWSLWLSTPEGRNHFYEAYQRGKDPENRMWESWRMPSWLNPAVFPEGEDDDEIAEMRAEMTEQRFAQEVGADFSEYVGRVFKIFDEDIHVRDLHYDPRYPIYAACDYGWTNPFVWLILQVDVFDNVYVLAEYRQTERDIEDIAADLVTWRNGISRNVKMFYPDPAGPGDSAILKKKLHIPFNSATGGELRYRLQYINQALKPLPEHAPVEDRLPRLLIDRSCVELIREMNDYRYPELKSEIRENPEEPLKKDDHGPEALGRFFRGHYGAPTDREGTNARVRRARVRA